MITPPFVGFKVAVRNDALLFAASDAFVSEQIHNGKSFETVEVKEKMVSAG